LPERLAPVRPHVARPVTGVVKATARDPAGRPDALIPAVLLFDVQAGWDEEKTAMWEFGRTGFRTIGTDVPYATKRVVCTNVDWTAEPGNGPPLSN
jgi:hypothetical protein